MLCLFPSLATLLPASAIGHAGVRRSAISLAGFRVTVPHMLMSDDELLSDFTLTSRLHQLPRLELGRPSSVVATAGVNLLFVLLFNKGESNQGVYTLKSCHASKEGDYLLAFECNDEASRFALMLQAEGFDLPSPTIWESDDLVSFCTDTEFSLGFVPDGAIVLPPELNKYDESAFSDERETHDEQKQLQAKPETWLDMFMGLLMPLEDSFSDALSALEHHLQEQLMMMMNLSYHHQEQLEDWLAEGEGASADQGVEEGEEAKDSLHGMMLRDQRGRLERLYEDGSYSI